MFFSALEGAPHASSRFLRAKALAERAVRESGLRHTIFAPSVVYSPGDHYLTLLERLSLGPVMPIAGTGRALFQPIWAEDVADCVVAALRRTEGDARYELAGPDTISHEGIVRLALRSFGKRNKPIVRLPLSVARRALQAGELLLGPAAPATWDEAGLLEISMTAGRGTADAESLGVAPRPMAAVLGTG